VKLTENVYKLDCTKGAYAYAVIDNGAVLIDTGMPGRAKAITLELEAYGIRKQDISRILLTHHDIDHVGNADFFQRNCGCEVCISKEDYPYFTGELKRPGIKNLLGKLIKVKVPEKISILDSQKVDNILVINTPGHTPGHRCFRFGDVLFAGDLVRILNGKVTLSPTFMTWDKSILSETISRLPMLGIRIICPAHGEPLELGNSWDEFLKTINNELSYCR
jgi:glyoxylase-like metal-dependent hydrolase (beta-lactamase superfamily II)